MSAILNLLALITALGISAPAIALTVMPTTNQAGLVVVHEDGSVVSRCVGFNEESISGYELLVRGGFAPRSEVTSMGASVCSLDGQGCGDGQDCFCRCKSSTCAYWTFWQQLPEGWRYSGAGAATVQVHDGDLHGWVWGESKPNSSAEITPPMLAFTDVCNNDAVIYGIGAAASAVPPRQHNDPTLDGGVGGGRALDFGWGVVALAAAQGGAAMKHTSWQRRLGSLFVYGLTTLIGIVAFLYPFWLPAVTQGNEMGMAHAGDAPLLLTLLVGLAFAVLLLEVQTAAGSAKMVALLGVLVAINSVLRFADAAIPGPGGFSPLFVLMILGGYVFGARVGFLLGTLTFLVSALITGGVGPWLPYQMFTAGWVGMSAPLCRPLVDGLGWRGKWGETLLLALLGALWGLLYGVIMNLWFWPYAVGGPDQYWTPGLGLVATVQRYALFYITTSFAWDAMRALGNLLLLLAFGGAILRVLRRFHARFAYSYTPLTPLSAPTKESSFRPTTRATTPLEQP